MRSFTVYLLLFLFFAGCAPRKPELWESSRDSSYVFDLKALPVVTIRVSPGDWKRLNSSLESNHLSETSVKVDFQFEKNNRVFTLRKVGFRVKGSVWSKRAPQLPDGKFATVHFRVGFDTYQKKQRFFGLRKLILRGFRVDPLYAREVLAHDLLNRFGAAVQRASYARLVIRIGGRTVRYGVYAMLEPVDRVFLRSRFNDEKGHLWKCLTTKAGGEAALTNRLPLSAAEAGIEVHRNNPVTNYQPTYDLKCGDFAEGKKALESFIRNLNTLEGEAFEKWALRAMDVEGLLRFYAMHVLIGSFDDYWYNGKNYYLYRSASGVWHFIQSDYDYCFGSGHNYGGENDFSVRDVFRWGKTNRPLMNKILARPRFRTMYAGYLKKALADGSGLFTVSAVRKRLRSFHTLIRPFVRLDRVDTAPYKLNNFHRIEDSPLMFWNASSVKFRVLSGDEKDSYLDRRINSARKQLQQNQ